MASSTLLRHVNLPLGLLAVPFVVLALAGPAGAETKSQPAATAGTPSTQSGAPSAQKLKLDTDTAQPGPSQGAAPSGSSQGTAQSGAGQGAAQSGQGAAQSGQGAAQSGNGQSAAQPGANGAQAGTKSAEDKKASQPAEEGAEPLSDNPKQIVVNIDKSTQEMTVFIDGVETYNWKVSTGRPGFATPSGTYTATSMNKIWYSKEWDNAPMPHAVFFMKDGHAIHGTTEVKNLGKPASHGCVRLAPENAAILYDLVKENGLKNTQVVLNGETPGGDYQGGIASARPQYQYPQYPYGYGRPVPPPWFYPNQEAQVQPDQQPRPRRRGLFRWFQQNQGYYVAPPRYYQRGYGY